MFVATVAVGAQVAVIKGRSDVAPIAAAAAARALHDESSGKSSGSNTSQQHSAPGILILTYSLFVQGSAVASAIVDLKPPMVRRLNC